MGIYFFEDFNFLWLNLVPYVAFIMDMVRYF